MIFIAVIVLERRILDMKMEAIKNKKLGFILKKNCFLMIFFE